MTKSRTVLIVAEDLRAAGTLKAVLIQNGMKVLLADQRPSALELVRLQKPDMVIMDILFSNLDSWEVCWQVRQLSPVPLIILTDHDDEALRILALELGADACLPRSVSSRELLARIKAIFRRIAFAMAGGETTLIQIGNVRLDTAAYKVYKLDQAMPLRQKEYELLHTLMTRAGQVISRAELLDVVWGVDWLGDTRTLDVHIRWVREKIEEAPSQPRYIQTIRGVGYRFASPVELSLPQ